MAGVSTMLCIEAFSQNPSNRIACILECLTQSILSPHPYQEN